MHPKLNLQSTLTGHQRTHYLTEKNKKPTVKHATDTLAYITRKLGHTNLVT